MIIKGVLDEDFVNYKKTSMFICTAQCGGKCCIEAKVPMSICQNNKIRALTNILMPDIEICKRYLGNQITSAVVIGGLEPMEQKDEVLSLIKTLRIDFMCADDVVIYTGYYPHEVEDFITSASQFDNIIMKFGRFVPDRPHRFDEILGVTLASDNQWAVKIT